VRQTTPGSSSRTGSARQELTEPSLSWYASRLKARWAPVYRHALISPVLYDEHLSEKLGRDIWLKAEQLQPGGSYKIRPAAFSLASLSPAQKERGAIAVSGGNFAVSVALAAKGEGIPLTLVMPKESFEEKKHLLEGTEVLFGDAPGYDAAEEKAKRLSVQRQKPFLSPTEGFEVYQGNSTIAHELIEQLPKLSGICAAVGGGGLCLGLSLAAAPLGIQVIGASPQAANAMQLSLQEKRAILQHEGDPTWAEPLSGGVPLQNYERAQFLFGVSLVSEEEMKEAMRLLYQRHGYFIEAAGAVAYALVASGRAKLPDEGDIAIVLSGGNLSPTRKQWVVDS
jgi:threonine dehydratase